MLYYMFHTTLTLTCTCLCFCVINMFSSLKMVATFRAFVSTLSKTFVDYMASLLTDQIC